jgi:hypothetical protein
MTMMSCDFTAELFADTETRENRPQHFVLRARTRDVVEAAARLVEIVQHELLGNSLAGGGGGALKRRARVLEQGDVPEIRDRRAIARQEAAAVVDNSCTQRSEAVARKR